MIRAHLFFNVALVSVLCGCGGPPPTSPSEKADGNVTHEPTLADRLALLETRERKAKEVVASKSDLLADIEQVLSNAKLAYGRVILAEIKLRQLKPGFEAKGKEEAQEAISRLEKELLPRARKQLAEAKEKLAAINAEIYELTGD